MGPFFGCILNFSLATPVGSLFLILFILSGSLSPADENGNKNILARGMTGRNCTGHRHRHGHQSHNIKSEIIQHRDHSNGFGSDIDQHQRYTKNEAYNLSIICTRNRNNSKDIGIIGNNLDLDCMKQINLRKRMIRQDLKNLPMLIHGIRKHFEHVIVKVDIKSDPAPLPPPPIENNTI